VVVVKVFILILYYDFLEDLAGSCILTYLWDSLLTYWLFGTFRLRNLRTLGVAMRLDLTTANSIQVDLVRIFVFEGTQTARWAFAKKKGWYIWGGRKIIAFGIIVSLRLLGKVTSELFSACSNLFYALHDSCSLLAWRVLRCECRFIDISFCRLDHGSLPWYLAAQLLLRRGLRLSGRLCLT
jgi:hypothetical protein